ncbi:MAG: hypothetical protein M3032_03910, partial [Verrucomicrobiota bacterium]|nr:hypothetical protein [Verrucomicrobiota bacterium]
TMHYRATHAPATVKLTPKQEYAAKRASRAANARTRSARGQAAIAAAKVPRPPLSATDDDE